MYEWIQEAIVKGMTDVHEIQRYARQKEISLVELLRDGSWPPGDVPYGNTSKWKTHRYGYA
jgi:hypothetical protein